MLEPEKLKFEKKSVTTGSGDIFYFSHFISKDRPTVLLLHGLTSNHTTWLDMAKMLDKNGFNVIAPDLRGHGYSDKTKKKELYRISNFRNDVELIIKQEGLQKVHIVGYSFGGYIGIDLAVARQELVGSLVLISTNHVNPLLYTHFYFITPFARTLANAIALLLIWQKRKQYYYFNHKDSSTYLGSTFKGYLTMPLTLIVWMLIEISFLDYGQSITEIKCPTLLIHGRGDSFLTETEIKDMASKIRNCKTVHLEQSGHFLASQYMDDIALHSVEFLNEIA